MATHKKRTHKNRFDPFSVLCCVFWVCVCVCVCCVRCVASEPSNRENKINKKFFFFFWLSCTTTADDEYHPIHRRMWCETRARTHTQCIYDAMRWREIANSIQNVQKKSWKIERWESRKIGYKTTRVLHWMGVFFCISLTGSPPSFSHCPLFWTNVCINVHAKLLHARILSCVYVCMWEWMKRGTLFNTNSAFAIRNVSF